MTPVEILQKVRAETDSVLLFHSATGKDSIVLADMCSKVFNRVVSVFMFIVPNLEHEEKFIRWTENHYPNLKFERYPHFALNSMLRSGFMGIKKQQLPDTNLSGITEMAREKTKLDWAIFGFKKYDSLSRRLMLRNYEDEAIFRKTRKCYPLTNWTNADCLKYIQTNRLPNPIKYTSDRSNGMDITDTETLLWLRNNYPGDLEKITGVFPLVKQKLFEYDYANQSK